mmetsp:Transcript_25252/g.79581  ORF Transcript_25252/g.79581 Transcript_25252/m.79581 type:complete len:325 (-) Transcript_25252:99-1073(-)
MPNSCQRAARRGRKACMDRDCHGRAARVTQQMLPRRLAASTKARAELSRATSSSRSSSGKGGAAASPCANHGRNHDRDWSQVVGRIVSSQSRKIRTFSGSCHWRLEVTVEPTMLLRHRSPWVPLSGRRLPPRSAGSGMPVCPGPLHSPSLPDGGLSREGAVLASWCPSPGRAPSRGTSAVPDPHRWSAAELPPVGVEGALLCPCSGVDCGPPGDAAHNLLEPLWTGMTTDMLRSSSGGRERLSPIDLLAYSVGAVVEASTESVSPWKLRLWQSGPGLLGCRALAWSPSPRGWPGRRYSCECSRSAKTAARGSSPPAEASSSPSS